MKTSILHTYTQLNIELPPPFEPYLTYSAVLTLTESGGCKEYFACLANLTTTCNYVNEHWEELVVTGSFTK
jgi:hypothetical protein